MLCFPTLGHSSLYIRGVLWQCCTKVAKERLLELSVSAKTALPYMIGLKAVNTNVAELQATVGHVESWNAIMMLRL